MERWHAQSTLHPVVIPDNKIQRVCWIFLGASMNKNDLVAYVSDTTGLAKGDATKAVDAVFDGISGALRDGVEVRLVGFGTFSVTERAASEGRNPRTGDKIDIPASRMPKFKAGKGLKDLVNGEA